MIRILTLNLLLVLIVLVGIGPSIQGSLYHSVAAQSTGDMKLDMSNLFNNIQESLSNPFDDLNAKNQPSSTPQSSDNNDMKLDMSNLFNNIQSTLTISSGASRRSISSSTQ